MLVIQRSVSAPRANGCVSRSRHHRAGKLGATEWVLVDKVAQTQSSGYTADYTRCYLPADAASAGELVEVSVEDLYADGLRVTPV